MSPSPTLHIETRGDAKNPPVLCLHGLMGAARNMWRVTDGLAAAGFYVIAFDQRGHGKSSWSDDYALEALASDALRVLTQKNINSAHFVGHSMGGRVALAASKLSPPRVRSLTLLDVGPRASDDAIQSIRQIMDPLPLEGFPNRAAAEAVMSRFSPAIGQFVYSNLRKASATTGGSEAETALQWIIDLKGLRTFLAQGIRVDQSDALKEARCPALMLRGSDSKHLSEAELSYAQGLKPDMKVGIVPGAGHWVHADNIESTLSQVRDFLKGLP